MGGLLTDDSGTAGGGGQDSEGLYDHGATGEADARRNPDEDHPERRLRYDATETGNDPLPAGGGHLPGESPPAVSGSGRLIVFGTGARLFHWTIAVLVAIQIPAGIAMTSEPLAGWADPLFVLHKGVGVVLLVLVLGRVAWRATHPAPPFPAYMPPLERRIAHSTHMAIYVLLVTMVVSGYVRTVGDEFPIELLDALGVPTLLPPMPGVAAAMLVVHQFTVVGLVALVAVHVSAVLRHHLIDGDPVLGRMWPPIAPRTRDVGGVVDGARAEGERRHGR
jgi:cytochrome b561